MDQVKITPLDLELSSYDYELPSELIASRPMEKRDESRLLAFDMSSRSITHTKFKQLTDLLPANSTLVLNQSKVFPCRLIGRKSTGGEAEAFVLSLLPKDGNYQVLLKAGGKRKIGDSFHFDSLVLHLTEIGAEGTFWVSPNFGHMEFLSFLELKGGIPIPPYIRDGIADEKDREDYQTVFAANSGSVAAPTAGLHFTPELLEQIKTKGHKIAYVTLHVGLGTFRPVKTATITDHQMHSENYSVSKENADLIRASKGRIVAVGTTALRVLESSWKDGDFDFPVEGQYRETRIFLHPGIPVHSICGLVTNFHLPQSSLLMLVSAIIGREKVLKLYSEAINERYRFFSYGDAMFIKRPQ